MNDFTTVQTLYTGLRLPYQLQGTEQGSATLTVVPDEQRVLGPAGAQLVYAFENGTLVSLEILVVAG
jgi:hypothetical protein